MNLLAKSRVINSMLQKTGGNAVDFRDMAQSLSDVICANVYIVSKSGNLLGYHIIRSMENKRMEQMLIDKQFPKQYVDKLQSVVVTSSNLSVDHELTAVPDENRHFFPNALTTIIPILGNVERLGTLILNRIEGSFTDDDLILGEYGATVVGMEILRARTEEIEKEIRTKAIVHMAIASLSYSEQEAIEHIFEELGGTEGILVASKIADRVGITRSVIVNALRKLESAGVIESRSLGMKGTHIRILNKNFLKELETLRSARS